MRSEIEKTLCGIHRFGVADICCFKDLKAPFAK